MGKTHEQVREEFAGALLFLINFARERRISDTQIVDYFTYLFTPDEPDNDPQPEQPGKRSET